MSECRGGEGVGLGGGERVSRSSSNMFCLSALSSYSMDGELAGGGADSLDGLSLIHI